MSSFDYKLKLALESIMDDAWTLSDKSAKEIKQQYNLNNLENWDIRSEFTKQFGWSLPCKEAVDAIKKHSQGQRIYDVMAGTGYWAKVLRDHGIDTIASDIGEVEWGFKAQHTEIGKMDARKAAGLAAKGKPIHLLLSWPPYEGSIGHKLLRMLPIGSVLYFIGESRGGCTGTQEMFDELHINYQEIDSVRLPQWAGIHDELTIYKKTSNITNTYHTVAVIYRQTPEDLEKFENDLDLARWEFSSYRPINVAIRKKAVILWNSGVEDKFITVKNGVLNVGSEVNPLFLNFKPDFTDESYEVKDKVMDHIKSGQI